MSSTGAVESLATESVPSRTTLLAFFMFVLFAGTAPVAARFTFGELGIFWGATLRFGAAALVFWLLALANRVPVPRGRALGGAALFGLLGISLPVILGYYGLGETQAGLFQTILAVVPLLTLVFAVAHGLERLTGRSVSGAVLALLGIVVAVSGSLAGGVEISLPHILAILIGAVCLAEGSVIAKLMPGVHPYMLNAIATTIATVLLVPIFLISGESAALPSTFNVWLALVFLAFGQTVTGFLLYIYVIRHWTASGASYAFVLTPLVAVIMGGLIIGETIAPLFIAGLVLVLAGVYVGAISRPRAEAEPEPVSPEEDLRCREGLPSCF